MRVSVRVFTRTCSPQWAHLERNTTDRVSSAGACSFAKTADRVAERDLSIGILDDFAREAALEATSLAVSHAEDKLRLGKVFAAAEHFPVTMIAVTIGDVVPHNFGFGEPKHTAEPFVAREDSPALVDLEARDIEIVFVFGHHIAPPLR